MAIKVKDLLIILLITALLIFSMEKVSGYLLKRSSNTEAEQAFRRQFTGDIYSFLIDCSYLETDPLLGWAMSRRQLEHKGWRVLHNSICLQHIEPGATDTLVIYITGGSTSDLGLNPECWPMRLAERLKVKHVSFIIYDGGVAAYGSSQELLKLLRDGLPLKPDIHISYSGANEYQNPYFVSPYEHTFYQKALLRAQNPPIMPKTVHLVRKTLGLDKNKLVLKEFPTTTGINSWKQNMATMQALAQGYGYRFIGILQPVVGFGQITDTKKDPNIQPLLEEYKIFYPGALEELPGSPYLHDFTHIFDDVGDKAFLDDCHIRNEYQDRIAKQVGDLIEK